MKDISSSGRYDHKVRVIEVMGNANLGGMETYMENFLTHLDPDQFAVTCICPYESCFTTTLRKMGITVYITPVEDDPAWRSIQLVMEAARLHDADVLHAHMPKAHILAGIAGNLSRKPVVATVHGMNVTSQELGIHRAVNSHIITNCQEAYFQALAMGILPNRVTRASNGVDIHRFSPANCGKELKRDLNIPDDVPVVGFVGRMEHEKGPDLFLRAAAYVHSLQPEVQFIMAGSGSMLPEIRELCAQLDMEANVHFTGWTKDTEKIYAALDILAQTSRSDGTSLVLLEAMASGCVCIGLAVGGLREIIENNHTGVLVGAHDWQGTGMVICELLNDPKRRKEMSVAARTRVEQHFDVRKNTAATADVLRRLAGKNRKSPKILGEKTENGFTEPALSIIK